jgi:tetratricopeptide (TPR) repeat protein
MPVEPGIARCEEIREAVEGQLVEAEVLRYLGGLHGFAGRFDVAGSLFAASDAIYADRGIGLFGLGAVISFPRSFVEMLAGDFAAAERLLRSGHDTLEALGENSLRSTAAAALARAILAQGRYGEANRFTELSERIAEPNDLLTQIVWRGVRARIVTMLGRIELAESLAREAVALAAATDFVNFHADALMDLAEVLETGGRAAEAIVARQEALALYERKGNLVAAAQTRALLDRLALV